MDYTELLDKVLNNVDKQLKVRHTVWFDVSREETTVFDNKIGGVPYFPKDMEYPKSKYSDMPLILLAQINFNTIPQIKYFPTTGILQFFIASDEVYGMNFDDLTKSDNFKVIYHKNIITDTSKLINKVYEPHQDGIPFVGEYKLTVFKEDDMVPDIYSYSFKESFIHNYNKLSNKPINSIYNLDDGTLEELYQRNTRGKVHIGGYPLFTQYDPREKEKYANYDIVLFELDSIYDKDTNIDIMWGDCGIGNFFITKDMLKNLKFNEVLYSWDCY